MEKKESVSDIVRDKKLNRQDRIELGRLFQGSVSSQDWELSERMIHLADMQTLNDLLCISLDSIWFLTTEGELQGITGLIGKIISHGAHDYTRATLRTSFLASCVSSCHSLTDTVTVMAQRYTLDSLITCFPFSRYYNGMGIRVFGQVRIFRGGGGSYTF